MPKRKTDEEKNKVQANAWFRECIYNPARARWGFGWSQLSEDQQQTEIQAQAFRVLTSSGRIEDAETDEAEAASLGRHVVYIQRLLCDNTHPPRR